jgi:flavorubredoxin
VVAGVCLSTRTCYREPAQIADGVFWVGVNDCVKDLFESLWPIPYGVSYNAYVVEGSDGVAVIDGVDEHLTFEYLEKIREVVGSLDRVRYVVLNHLEPDHHASTPKLLSLARNAEVVLTPVAARLIGALYRIPEGRLVEVRDGESIDLGGRRLRFIHTPWLHWPETMMTYLEELGILFSCDAFGSYGALTEGLFDDEVDLEFYLEEARRYFSNIVLKYSRNVLEALSKIERLGLRISVLAPSHGPIYRRYVDRILALYRDLSIPKRCVEVSVIYGSMYGRTENLVEQVARRFRERGVDVKVVDAARVHPSYTLSEVSNSGALIFIFPTYDASVFPPVREVMNYLQVKQAGRGRAAAVVNTYSWGASAKEAVEILTKAGFQVVEPVIQLRPLPTEEDLRKLEELVDVLAREVLKYEKCSE